MTKKILILALLIITVLLIAGCIQKPKPAPLYNCGNGVCEPEENGNNCPKDCCVSEDGKCPSGCTSVNDNDCKIGCETSITCEEGYVPYDTGKTDAQGCPVRKCVKKEVDKESIKVETICTDGIDNDGDGLTDNEDGDCWIKEGAVFMEDFKPVRTFKDLAEMPSELKEIGIKTIELLPIWDHPSYYTPEMSDFVRWGVRDYSKFDPERGNENELLDFIASAHNTGLKIVPVLDITTTFPPSNVCKNKIMPGYKLYYDTDKIGGFYYQYQLANPEKDILLENLKGEFDCAPTGFGFVVNQDSKDFIELVQDLYRKQIVNRNFDGLRLDAPVVNHCITNEKIDFNGKVYDCLDPVAEKHSPLPLYRQLKAMSPPNYVFLSEHTTTNLMFHDYQVKYPYYSSDPDMDEVAEATEGYEFEKILLDIISDKITPSGLIEWINNQPILHNRTRFRMIRNWNNAGKIFIEFVAKDSRYYPAVTLASTIPGIPKITDYELFGGEYADKDYKITPTNSVESRKAHWKKVLTVRNSNNALKYGDIKNVWKSGDNTYAYSRTYEGETIVIVINFNGKQATSVLDVPFAAGTTLKDELSGETFTVANAENFKISVPGYSSRILTFQKK